MLLICSPTEITYALRRQCMDHRQIQRGKHKVLCDCLLGTQHLNRKQLRNKGLDIFLECMQGEMDIQDLTCILVWEL